MITPRNVFRVVLCTLLICISCLFPVFFVAYEYGISGGLVIYVMSLAMIVGSYVAVAVIRAARRRPRVCSPTDIISDAKSSSYEISEMEMDSDIFITESSGKLLLDHSSYQC